MLVLFHQCNTSHVSQSVILTYLTCTIFSKTIVLYVRVVFAVMFCLLGFCEEIVYWGSGTWYICLCVYVYIYVYSSFRLTSLNVRFLKIYYVCSILPA